jgi:hypothetical protein
LTNHAALVPCGDANSAISFSISASLSSSEACSAGAASSSLPSWSPCERAARDIGIAVFDHVEDLIEVFERISVRI